MNQELNDVKGQSPQYTDGVLPSDMGAPLPDMGATSAITAQPPGAMYQANVIPTVIPMVVGSQMGPKEAIMTCKSCNQQIVTKIEHNATTRTHLIAALFCICGCWPCACATYCINSCQNADHYCPNCSAYIGTHQR